MNLLRFNIGSRLNGMSFDTQSIQWVISTVRKTVSMKPLKLVETTIEPLETIKPEPVTELYIVSN